MTARSASPRVHARSLTALLSHAVDYAGLYPPAALAMSAAVREYHTQRTSPDAWALGHFVVGVSQLDAFLTERREIADEPWPLAVLASGSVERDVAAITSIASSWRSLVNIMAIEAKAESVAAVAVLEPFRQLAGNLYVELPVTAPLAELLVAVRALGARAKIRTGGVTADAFPSAVEVALFMRACADHGVPFKATAGLHHLLRGEYPFTYDKGSPRGTMFGFLNIFVAAALARRDAATEVLVQVLEERDPHAFTLCEGGGVLCWRDECLTSEQLSASRDLLGSFGSCSFGEPVAELASAFAGAA